MQILLILHKVKAFKLRPFLFGRLAGLSHVAWNPTAPCTAICSCPTVNELCVMLCGSPKRDCDLYVYSVLLLYIFCEEMWFGDLSVEKQILMLL